MATLYFKVSSDYDEVIRLRQECEKLEAQLKKMDVNKSPAAARALETQLASTRQQMMSLVTEAGRVGAVMENDLKNKLNSASKASDGLTEEIIKQRKIIRDTQDDVRRLSDEYSKMGRYSPNSKAKLAELNRAKAALNEQRYAMGELQDQQAKNRLEVRKLTREYKEFAQGGSNADEVVKSLTDSLKRTAAEFGGLVAIKKFVSDVIDATGKMQQLDVALSTILQSKSKADALLAEISEFAKKTPFNLDEVANGAKQLLAYGSSADNVVDELSMLGDVASGLQIPLGQLIYLYGTLRVQGRAYWRDIQQFQGRGVNVVEEMAKNLGVTQDQIKSLVEEGKIGFKDVEKAFQSMTSEGGKFNNMLENSAGTWPQRIANIEDTLFQKMNEFGNKYKEVFEFGIGTAEDLVESLDDVISVIGALVAAYGTYKAALIAVAVWQKASSILNMTKSFLNLAKGVNVATAAMKAFNITSKANLFGALFSVIAGVTTAVYMFTKRTDEATVAQEALNSVNKKADEEFSRQAATIDRLNGILKSETSSIDQKKKALSDLQSIIPSYNASLNEEGRLINNNTEAIREYLTQLEKQIRLKAAQEELEELYKNKRLQEKDIKTKQEAYEQTKKSNPIGVVYGGDSGIEAQRHSLNRVANAEKALNKANKKLENTESQIKAIEKEIGQSSLSDKSNTPKSTISKEIENATTRIRSLKKEISGLRSGKIEAEAGKTVESTIKAKEKELQNAEKTLETLTGVSNKTVSQGNSVSSIGTKISDLQRIQAIDRAREAVDMENQIEQARIDAMADGGDKILAQRELNNKKEMQAIDRDKEEYIQKEIQRQKEIFEATEDLKAKKNPKYKRRSFDSSSVSVDTSAFDILKENTDKRQVQEDLNAQREAMNAYLAEYGTYMQKRQAIIEQYQDKINMATTEGDKLTLGKQRDKMLSDFDEQANKTTSAISQLFGDMKDKTLKDLEAINTAGQEALEFLKSGQWDEQKGKEFGITKENFEIWSNDPEKIKAITDALLKNKKAAEELRPAYDKVADGLKRIFNSGNDTKKLDEALNDLRNGLSEILQVSSFLSDTFSSLGESLGANAFSGIAEGINVAMDSLNSVMQGAEVGSVFGPVGSAVGATVGFVSSISSAFAKIHDKKNEKQIQKLQKQIDVLTESYDKLGESVEEAYSKDASGLIGQQNEMLEQQKVLIEQQIKEEKDKKDTDKKRIEEWENQIDEINDAIKENKEKAVDAIFGEDLKTAIENFSSAYADAWSNGEEKAESAKETVKNMMRQMVTESIKSAIQASGSMEKIRQKLQEFYADNVLSGWEQDYIYNMAEEIQKDLDKQFGWADDLFEEDSSKQQSASSRGFETMSQDSADELNGRFTAVYESNLRIESAEQKQTVAITELRGSISALISQASGIYNIADETRTILVNSYLELQQIRENTGEIVKPIKQIQADIAEVKRNTSRL